ncbi:hypothetical protein RF11_13852 [Thelohanellus kitauei]|uniref:Uncharacterized protein n=1 Tax=Thelohanellus kitauei TaxID=669202 RepID=A0A0C2JDI7_THEKT|nr:hypothetical protein RF11_13852 [Thelohanellus kitauei]
MCPKAGLIIQKLGGGTPQYYKKLQFPVPYEKPLLDVTIIRTPHSNNQVALFQLNNPSMDVMVSLAESMTLTAHMTKEIENIKQAIRTTKNEDLVKLFCNSFQTRLPTSFRPAKN